MDVDSNDSGFQLEFMLRTAPGMRRRSEEELRGREPLQSPGQRGDRSHSRNRPEQYIHRVLVEPRSWRPDGVLIWPWCMKSKGGKGMPIELHLP